MENMDDIIRAGDDTDEEKAILMWKQMDFMVHTGNAKQVQTVQ